MAQQCPKCLSHYEHIYTIEISPKTNQRWRIERCPRCDQSFDFELEREYHARKSAEKKPDIQRNTWLPGD